ncbi:hypothetical protein BGW37DRAFT_221515 [Umbelopsis sp. PMI_123]|nr:hypothetical protein BGW37DRAFT_221515 [Umbelopsis sp. PMI_123]
MLLVSRTNQPLPSPPLPPRGIGKIYRNVQQVTFRSRAAYFGTISDLRRINSTARWLMYQLGHCFKLRKILRAQKVVIFSVAINVSNTKSITEIAWTMFDTKYQRVLDQHYIISDADEETSETASNDMIGRRTPIIISTEQALKELEKDIIWATNRDKIVALLAYDLRKCLLALKHHGWTRSWAKPNGADETDMFCLREMYEVMSKKLGHRAFPAEIFDYVKLSPNSLGDTGKSSKLTTFNSIFKS